MAGYETQVCVIAAGPSGLSAAVQAAEDGAEVIVLEKASGVGGAANMGMGPLGIGTKYQKQNMQDITVEKAFGMFMEYTHYNVDARLVKRYFEQSAETIEWLEDMGVEFEGAFKYFPQSEPTWHIVKTDTGIGPRAASFMNKALYAKAQELGVKFLLETPAKKILMEEGRVVGVLATDKNGQEVKITCKAAIICTGGAGCNPELKKLVISMERICLILLSLELWVTDLKWHGRQARINFQYGLNRQPVWLAWKIYQEAFPIFLASQIFWSIMGANAL